MEGTVAMTALRILLVAVFLAIAVYTVPVVAEYGLFSLFGEFFGAIGRGNWQGQFNVDFLCFLFLSAAWTIWRNRFTPGGIVLGVLAFLGGALFLSAYLLILSFRTREPVVMLVGSSRRFAAPALR